ncbi:MAG: serine/threonine protein kinase [Lachnospiraceae bacterium]|nr:serine/threonine protein kinase [Lachnospiraceae bacterium]
MQGTKDLPVVPGYRILGILGRGGMGCVYLAEHEELHKKYALKHAAGEVEREQLRREAAAMRDLTDRRIPYLVDLRESREATWLVMEYVEGVSLAEELKKSVPLEEEAAIGLLREMAEIVAYLHRQRNVLIHRDLKPENFVRAKDGSLHLLDFGTALSEIALLRKKELCGTPGYAAPEQMHGGIAGTEADVYALGAVFSYMLTGVEPALPPFHPAGAEDCPEAVSADTGRLLTQLIAAAPERRPQDAVRLLERLPVETHRKKPVREMLAQIEERLYQIFMWGLVTAACWLLRQRTAGQAVPQAEFVCGGMCLFGLFWYLLRGCVPGRERFVKNRVWNVIYTEKDGYGL